MREWEEQKIDSIEIVKHIDSITTVSDSHDQVQGRFQKPALELKTFKIFILFTGNKQRNLL